MPFIRESIVTTRNADGTAHIAPLGIIEEDDLLVVAPFHPSTTLDNLRREPHACINYTTDVRIFAGCVTRRQRHWETAPTFAIPGHRLAAALAHSEVEVVQAIEDEQRPRFRCRELRRAVHGPFLGMNRAQAAVVEGAILVSRLHLLPRARVLAEIAHLDVVVAKTAGPAELEAWRWIKDAVAEHPGPAERG